MTNIMTFCGAGICAVFAIAIIRELKKEYTTAVVLTICVIFSIYIIPKIGEAVDFVREVSAYLEDTYTDTLIRALGITYLTCTASEICKASGEATVGGYIELAGRVEIMILCIPLFRELTELALL